MKDELKEGSILPGSGHKNLIDFSIIIPARNEENNIILTLTETSKVFKQFGCSFEIIVVDDGSTDKTCAAIQEFIGARPENANTIKIGSYGKNQGKGYALKYGTSLAKGRHILFLDADLDLHPSIAVELYSLMRDRDADAVIGSKMHKKSILHYPFLRKLASYSYYIIIKILFRLAIKDTQTGIKLFKHEVLADCLPKVLIKRYAFDLELLVAINKKGYKIVEAPVKVDLKRRFGRVGVKDAFRVFFDTMGVFYRLNFRKYYY